MRTVLFHKLTNKFWANTEGIYAIVAVLNDKDHYNVFESTQNEFYKNGWCNDDQILSVALGIRSTSVGDVFYREETGKVYMINTVGMKEITGDESERFVEMAADFLNQHRGYSYTIR